MRGRAIFWRLPAFVGNLLVCLLLMTMLFGCKDKAEEVSGEQQKKNVASKEQKEEADATSAHTTELTLRPAKASEPAQKYQLLLKVAEQIDADAAPLYEQALQALLAAADHSCGSQITVPLPSYVHCGIESALGPLAVLGQMTGRKQYTDYARYVAENLNPEMGPTTEWLTSQGEVDPTKIKGEYVKGQYPANHISAHLGFNFQRGRTRYDYS